MEFRRRNHVALINDNLGRVLLAAMPPLEKLARLAGARLVAACASARESRRAPSCAARGDERGNGRCWPAATSLHATHFLLDARGQPGRSADAPPRSPQVTPPRTPRGRIAQFACDSGAWRRYRGAATGRPAGGDRPFRFARDSPELDGRYTVSRGTIKPAVRALLRLALFRGLSAGRFLELMQRALLLLEAFAGLEVFDGR